MKRKKEKRKKEFKLQWAIRRQLDVTLRLFKQLLLRIEQSRRHEQLYRRRTAGQFSWQACRFLRNRRTRQMFGVVLLSSSKSSFWAMKSDKKSNFIELRISNKTVTFVFVLSEIQFIIDLSHNDNNFRVSLLHTIVIWFYLIVFIDKLNPVVLHREKSFGLNSTARVIVS